MKKHDDNIRDLLFKDEDSDQGQEEALPIGKLNYLLELPSSHAASKQRDLLIQGIYPRDKENSIFEPLVNTGGSQSMLMDACAV